MENKALNNERLTGNEETLELLTKFLPVAVYSTDENGLISYFNDHAIKLWGRKPKLNDPKDRFCGSWKIFDANGYKLLSHEIG